MAEGALSSKHKGMDCPGHRRHPALLWLHRFHRQGTAVLGATAELEEMLAVCVYMGGGPALMYTAEALKAWDTMAAAAAIFFCPPGSDKSSRPDAAKARGATKGRAQETFIPAPSPSLSLGSWPHHCRPPLW